MDTLTPEQLITNPCSHNGDVVDAGGRNGYPSDSQAALNKLHVELSDDSDQADEELASVTSGPVSAHTRSKCSGASRKGGDSGRTGQAADEDSTIITASLISPNKNLIEHGLSIM